MYIKVLRNMPLNPPKPLFIISQGRPKYATPKYEPGCMGEMESGSL